MADYNIQIKQFNGNDYDNLYPATLASLVKFTPDSGIQATDLQNAIKEVNSIRPYVISGQYVGTGTYGSSNTNSLTFDKPVVFLVVMNNTNGLYANSNGQFFDGFIWCGQQSDSKADSAKDQKRLNYYTALDGKTIQWYSIYDANTQLNSSGVVYKYIAILSDVNYVPEVGSKFIYTSDYMFEVPITGNYKIELYGGGGSGGVGHYTSSSQGDATSGSAGGGSGQVYNSVELTKGESYQITIGKGGVIYTGSYLPSGTNGVQGGTTSFGTYSVAGGYGGFGTLDGTKKSGGSPSGNIASQGENGKSWDQMPCQGGSGGSTIGYFGNGGQGLVGTDSGGAAINGKDGAVILTYLGG